RNEQGEALGSVTKWLSSGAQDVMEVADSSRTRLIPWVSAIVMEVDLAARRITVDWGADW
ncbi:MAG TPA: PRC-barrel domain-containing protein, partial [Burkholderiales bacterium]|nr:PRC-barrel domain-containing protein [Burkholderiales bacterium]